jgi:hypothetical protein
MRPQPRGGEGVRRSSHRCGAASSPIVTVCQSASSTAAVTDCSVIGMPPPIRRSPSNYVPGQSISTEMIGNTSRHGAVLWLR